MGLILGWIDAGAPEFCSEPAVEPTPTPAPTATPMELNFAVVKPIFEFKCLRCHDGVNHDDKENFDIFDYRATFSLRRKIEDYISRPDIDKKRMPPIKKPQLTPDEFKLLTDWLKAGAPQ